MSGTGADGAGDNSTCETHWFQSNVGGERALSGMRIWEETSSSGSNNNPNDWADIA